MSLRHPDDLPEEFFADEGAEAIMRDWADDNISDAEIEEHIVNFGKRCEARGWQQAQRWLVEIFELDAARKMQMKIDERTR